MHKVNTIKNSLFLQGIPVDDSEIPYIQSVLSTIQHSHHSLNTSLLENDTVPIVIVDQGLIQQ